MTVILQDRTHQTWPLHLGVLATGRFGFSRAGWGLRFCISSQLSGSATGPWALGSGTHSLGLQGLKAEWGKASVTLIGLKSSATLGLVIVARASSRCIPCWEEESVLSVMGQDSPPRFAPSPQAPPSRAVFPNMPHPFAPAHWDAFLHLLQLEMSPHPITQWFLNSLRGRGT